MLNVIGIFLLVGGCTAIGMQSAAKLNKRVTTIIAWRAAIEQLHAEMSSRVRALPELVLYLSQSGPDLLRDSFMQLSIVYSTPHDARYSVLWGNWINSLSLEKEERDILRDLGNSLGQHELDSQLSAFESADKRLAAAEQRALLRRDKLSRLYAAGGLLCGAAIAVILI